LLKYHLCIILDSGLERWNLLHFIITFFSLLVNLSLALKSVEPNKVVGLLDADVYGPSIPLMMGLHESPLLTKGTVILAIFQYLQVCL
jgi:hypothetical protein